MWVTLKTYKMKLLIYLCFFLVGCNSNRVANSIEYFPANRDELINSEYSITVPPLTENMYSSGVYFSKKIEDTLLTFLYTCKENCYIKEVRIKINNSDSINFYKKVFKNAKIISTDSIWFSNSQGAPLSYKVNKTEKWLFLTSQKFR